METFLITFLIMALAVAGMAIGVLVGRRPIRGSCGGLGALGLKCGNCSRPCERRALGTEDETTAAR